MVQGALLFVPFLIDEVVFPFLIEVVFYAIFNHPPAPPRTHLQL